MKYIEFVVKEQREDALGKYSFNYIIGGMPKREYIYCEFSNIIKDSLSKNMTESFANKTHFIKTHDDNLSHLEEIKLNFAEGRIAMRHDSDGTLSSLIRTADDSKLFAVHGVDNNQLADYLGLPFEKKYLLLSYFTLSIHTFIMVQDIRTGEYIFSMGFNPHKHKAFIGKLYGRDEKIYYEIYSRQNDYKQGYNGAYNGGSSRIDFFITEEQFETITTNQKKIDDFLSEPDNIQLSDDNLFTNLYYYLFNTEVSPVPNLIHNKVYNLITNNCNIIASTILDETGIVAKSGHPFLFHEFDKLNSKDGGISHNMVFNLQANGKGPLHNLLNGKFFNLPLGYTLLNTFFLKQVFYYGWGHLELGDHLFDIKINLSPNLLHIHDDTDTPFMSALRSGNLAEAYEILKQDPEKIANTPDHMKIFPLAHAYCIKDKKYNIFGHYVDEGNKVLKNNIIEALLNYTHKENINKLDHTNMYYTLFFAAKCGNANDVEKLITEGGAEVRLKSKIGNIVSDTISGKFPEMDKKLLIFMKYDPEAFSEKNNQIDQNSWDMLNCNNVSECENKLTNHDPYDTNFDFPEYLHQWTI